MAEVNRKMAEQTQMQDSRLVFKSKGPSKEKKEKSEELCLKSDYYNMLFLNINSFMGGVTNIWDNGKDKELNHKHTQFSPISTNDGKLAVVCFGSSVGMDMERMFSGFATRIAQGGGPYSIAFNRYEDVEKHRTYLQIDGEFIRFTHPRVITVSRSQLGKGGKIRVLRRNLEAEGPLQL